MRKYYDLYGSPGITRMVKFKNSNKLKVTIQTINAYKTLLRQALRTYAIRGQRRQ